MMLKYVQDGVAAVYYTLSIMKGRERERETGKRVSLPSCLLLLQAPNTRFRSSHVVSPCLRADAWLNIHFHISRYVSNVKREHARTHAHKFARARAHRKEERTEQEGCMKGMKREKRPTGTERKTSLSPRVVSTPPQSRGPPFDNAFHGIHRVLPIPDSFTLTGSDPPRINTYASLQLSLSFSLIPVSRARKCEN